MVSIRLHVLGVFVVAFGVGCTRNEPAAKAASGGPALRHVVLQTDWFPQGEHGGYYQALAKGFYRDAGLDVEIRAGGSGAKIKLEVARGDADFGMNRSDDIIMAASQGLPVMIVAATMQHDPQAVMVREESPVKTLRDLQGRSVIANVHMTWIPYFQKKLGIAFNLVPNTYNLTAFLADPGVIQQCLVTNEPFFVAQRGVKVRVIALSDSGYDCYQAVFCRRELVRDAPDVVAKFVQASIHGWRDYVENDPTPAHDLILRRNAQMSPELLRFSRREMILRSLVAGDRGKGEDVGQVSLPRLRRDMQALLDLKVLEAPVAIESVATTRFLPHPTNP